MNRLQNAQKLLAESLDSLESAILQCQKSASQFGAAKDLAGGTGLVDLPGSAAIDLGHLSKEVIAIEADIATAIQMIADLTEQNASGDNA